MKTWFKNVCRISCVVLGIVIFLSAQVCFAAGTVSITKDKTTKFYNERVVEYLITWTADSAAATVPATATDTAIVGYVFMAQTNPGTTAPTDDYDITLTDADGIDVFGGELLNRDEANSEQTVPKVGSSVYGSRFVNSVLTFNLSNNAVNSATGTVRVYVYTD
jgi:hypothetical protein